ncbi:hypothetical protein V2J09_002393 [Rumex salicifolius]
MTLQSETKKRNSVHCSSVLYLLQTLPARKVVRISSIATLDAITWCSMSECCGRVIIRYPLALIAQCYLIGSGSDMSISGDVLHL